MNCNSCSNIIEFERLEALPTTKMCIKCAHKSDDKRVRPIGVMVYTDKTNGFIEIHSSASWSKNKKYYVANGARSAVKNFSKNVCA